jgi:hypothetical protein
VRQAQVRYNDRGSEEGQQAHRLEEAERRARRSAASVVGDHRCPAESGELRAPSSTAPHAVAEVLDAAPVYSAAPPAIGAPHDEREATPVPMPVPVQLQWLLVAWPEVLDAARRRAGSEAGCPFCGRRGRIVEVISIDQWRRRFRRGLGQER